MNSWDPEESYNPLEDLEKDPSLKPYKVPRPSNRQPRPWNQEFEAEISKAWVEGFFGGILAVILIVGLWLVSSTSPKYNPKARPTEPPPTTSTDINKLWKYRPTHPMEAPDAPPMRDFSEDSGMRRAR